MFEKQYFSSQIITTAIMFLTNGSPGLRSQGESCPQFKQSRQYPTRTARKNGPASVQAHRERVSEIEGNGVLDTFHFNGLQQGRLHICNHSFFNLILVSNTFSGPNTSKKRRHLIGRYSMPGLESSESMC